MPLHVDFCRIGKEIRILPGQLKCKSVPSLTSQRVVEGDGKQVSDLSDAFRFKISLQGDASSSGGRYLAHTRRPASSSSFLSVKYRQANDIKYIDHTASFASLNKLHSDISSSSALPPVEKPRSPQHLRPAPAVQASELSSTSTTSTFRSSSVSTHSPSPVRVTVVSPLAARTIAPDRTPDTFPEPLIVLSDERPPSASHSPIAFTQSTCAVPHNSTQQSSVYPDHLNPFDSEFSEPHDSLNSEEPPSFARLTYVSTIPFDDHYEAHTDPSPRSELATSVSPIRSKKKPAPPPPSNHCNGTDNRGYMPNGRSVNQYHSTASYSYNGTLLNGLCRQYSTCEIRATDSHSSVETRSMIVKRPAPPLPVYDKRIVNGDPSDSFVSYEELHELLYSTTQRVNSLEQQARRLQQEIKQAKKKRGNVDKLLDKWSRVVEMRDRLSRKQTQLVARLRRQELEERHANLEHEFRQLWAKQTILKTPEEKEREIRLLDELLDTVNQRAKLVDHPPDEDINEHAEINATYKSRKPHKIGLAILKSFRKSIHHRRSQSVLSFRR